jgi:hypothetical protein
MSAHDGNADEHINHARFRRILMRWGGPFQGSFSPKFPLSSERVETPPLSVSPLSTSVAPTLTPPPPSAPTPTHEQILRDESKSAEARLQAGRVLGYHIRPKYTGSREKKRFVGWACWKQSTNDHILIRH